ncbi:MAG: type IX secretion system membrane protein PorP/SprF [Bacteroidetes bacterium]|nr:type IX secretion system membrane protein PorP/SprF [Bacteroidota bacterium]HET6243597.1 type IX secretion system membrane protein PorP/SprF [Bacteroidia bacterium]
MKRYRNIKTAFSVILLIVCFQDSMGQDMQFTQFYAAQTYLNPAFTGIHGCSKVSSNFRDQWPSIPGSFVSYTFSYDQNLPSLNGSLGVLFTNDKAGSGKLRSTGINLLYAYEVPISKTWMVRAGLQGGINSRNINYNDLIFGDQIARGGAATSIHANNSEMALYADLSTGTVVYSQNYWIGLSAHHLNRPNQSLLNDQSTVPVKYSLHAGTRIQLDEPTNSKDGKYAIYPAFNLKSQGKFDQLDLGLYYGYSVMTLGIWYRGIPLFKAYEPGYSNHDAVALLAGFVVDKLQIGYSYDITVSRLKTSTAGAHEITLNYIFCKANKKKKRIVVPCPKF